MAIPRRTNGMEQERSSTEESSNADTTNVSSQPSSEDTSGIRSSILSRSSARTKHTGPMWEPMTVNYGRFTIMSVMGADKSGKTHFAFSAQAPILVQRFDNDTNYRGVLKKYPGKQIYQATYELPKGLVSNSALMSKAQEEQDRFRNTVEAFCEDASMRTMIWDREDEVWELWRNAEFHEGKAKGHHYTPVNTDYKAMIKKVVKAGKTLIMLDNIKDEWKNEKPTGRYIKEGFKHLDLMTEITLEAAWDAGQGFSLTVRGNRDDATKNGTVMTQENMKAWSGLDEGMTYPTVMGYLVEGSQIDEWR